MLLQLTASSGSQTFDLPSGATLVAGRALNSDLPVLDPTVSRRHAEVTSDGSGIELRDLRSRNGTFLNGARVERARAAPGDTIAFGSVKFRVRQSERPAAETPRSARAQRAASATVIRPIPPREAPGMLGASLTSTATGHLAVPTPPAAGAEGAAATEQSEAFAELVASQQKLALLLELSTALSRAIEIDALLEKIVEFTFQILDADLVAVLLGDEVGELVPKLARDRAGSAASRAVPQSIARTAVEQKVGVLSDDAPQDERFGSVSVFLQKVRSTMCAPLVGGDGGVLGVLYVDNLTATHRFRESDLEFLIAFAGIAAVAIENSRFAERLRREALVRSNFERYFAPSLAERIAASPGAAAPGGEKREVAVLFSDIRGFTALSEAMRPDETASLLSEYLSEMVEVVFRHGGTLDKFIGDAVMAQWGAPIHGDADADQAMAAALDMLRTLDALNARWRAGGRPELQVGIGLCYGEAFAGNIGSERRLEFTVIGDTVNTASRLCAAAGGGEILLSDSMRRALRAAPPLDECAPLELRGKSHAVPVFRVAVPAHGAPCNEAADVANSGHSS